MILYKVVSVGGKHTDFSGKFFSARIFDYGSPESRMFAVEYKVGEMVSAKYPGTKLFAFDSLPAAQNFSLCPEQIFKAEGTGISRPVQIVERGSLKKYYDDDFSFDGQLTQPPVGTVLCESIELIKRV